MSIEKALDGIPPSLCGRQVVGSSRLTVVVVVITPPLPRDGGTAPTAIQAHGRQPN